VKSATLSVSETIFTIVIAGIAQLVEQLICSSSLTNCVGFRSVAICAFLTGA
jgi:hypothetical protein